jgi:hypothetical protein
MPTRKPKKPGDNHDEPPRAPHEREPHEEEGSAVKIHEAYLQHRLGGGETPTSEAYRRAIEQFEKLPGAVRSSPDANAPKEPKEKTEPKTDQNGNEKESR